MCNIVSNKEPAKLIEFEVSARFEAPESYKPFHFASGFAKPLLPVLTSHSPNILMYDWRSLPFRIVDKQTGKETAINTLNAKSETIFKSPAFRDSIVQRRCVVLLDGFFESMHIGKQIAHFHIKGKDSPLLRLGGIWKEWKGEDERKYNHISLVTTPSNELMSKIHNMKKRMPLILSKETSKKWIQNDLQKEEIENLLLPFPDGGLSAVPIHKDFLKKDFDRTSPEALIEFDYGIEKFW